MPSSSWLRSARGRTTGTCLRTRTHSRASVRRLLFPTWSSEVSQLLLPSADLFFPAVMLTVSVQVRTRRPLRITLRNTSAGTWKDLVKTFHCPSGRGRPSPVVSQRSPFSLPRPSSDIDTRRRAACDLVRGLCKFFEGPVTAIFSGYVNSMLGEYAKNPGQNWKHKDAAIYLVTSLASKGQTQKVLANELLEEKKKIKVHLGEMLLFNLPVFFPPSTAWNNTSQSVGESQ